MHYCVDLTNIIRYDVSLSVYIETVPIGGLPIVHIYKVILL